MAWLLALGLGRDQCVTVRLRLLVFHSAPACDTVSLADMNLWKLRFASVHGNCRALAFDWKTRNAGPGANHRNGCEFDDISRKPHRSGPRANWTREAGGDVSPYDAFGRSSNRHEVIDAMVYARYRHQFCLGNDNVTSNAGVSPRISDNPRRFFAMRNSKSQWQSRSCFHPKIVKVNTTIRHYYAHQNMASIFMFSIITGLIRLTLTLTYATFRLGAFRI